jgi:hypothetical protein
MRTLKEYIKDCSVIDAHVHAFDANFVMSGNNSVVFPDIHSEMNSEQSFEDAYKKFSPNCKNMLACGFTDEQTVSIYNTYKKYMCGFGELLVNKLTEPDLDDVCRGWGYWKQTLTYANTNNLPILYHYDIDDVESYKVEMKSILDSYPNVRFIHAHCGITKPLILKQDKQAIFECERELLKLFPNYYLDFSWEVNKLFDVADFIASLPVDRWVIGSDTSAKLLNTHYEKYQELKGDFQNLFVFHLQSTRNIKTIYYL